MKTKRTDDKCYEVIEWMSTFEGFWCMSMLAQVVTAVIQIVACLL